EDRVQRVGPQTLVAKRSARRQQFGDLVVGIDVGRLALVAIRHEFCWPQFCSRFNRLPVLCKTSKVCQTIGLQPCCERMIALRPGNGKFPSEDGSPLLLHEFNKCPQISGLSEKLKSKFPFEVDVFFNARSDWVHRTPPGMEVRSWRSVVFMI